MKRLGGTRVLYIALKLIGWTWEKMLLIYINETFTFPYIFLCRVVFIWIWINSSSSYQFGCLGSTWKFSNELLELLIYYWGIMFLLGSLWSDRGITAAVPQFSLSPVNEDQWPLMPNFSGFWLLFYWFPFDICIWLFPSACSIETFSVLCNKHRLEYFHCNTSQPEIFCLSTLCTRYIWTKSIFYLWFHEIINQCNVWH